MTSNVHLHINIFAALALHLGEEEGETFNAGGNKTIKTSYESQQSMNRISHCGYIGLQGQG